MNVTWTKQTRSVTFCEAAFEMEAMCSGSRVSGSAGAPYRASLRYTALARVVVYLYTAVRSMSDAS